MRAWLIAGLLALPSVSSAQRAPVTPLSDGGGAITGPLLLPNGTAGAPSLSFSSDTDTGVYRVGANDLGFAANGALQLDISTALATFVVPVGAPDGSASAPGLVFAADLNTGVYRIGADNLGITAGGTLRLDISTTRALFANNVVTSGQFAQSAITTSTPSGTTQTIDFSTGNAQILTLASASGGVTVTLSNMMVGASYTIKVIQHHTAAKTATFTGVKWAGATAPTISTGADAVDLITLFYDGTTAYGAYVQDLR